MTRLGKHQNLLVGFFVFSSLLLFVAAIVALFGSKGFFKNEYHLYARFESGLGLRKGADVQFNGVKIGAVSELGLDEAGGGLTTGKVLVTLAIDVKYAPLITEYSVAFALRDKNLVSDRVINIESLHPGGRVLEDKSTIAVTDTRDIETVLTGVTKLITKMDALLINMAAIVDKTKDSNTTVGALLGSRVLYDQVMNSLKITDSTVKQGQILLQKAQIMEDVLTEGLPRLLNKSDTITSRLVQAAGEAQSLGLQSNLLVKQAQIVLSHTDTLVQSGTQKLEKTGDLVEAISQLWFLRGKITKIQEDRSLQVQKLEPSKNDAIKKDSSLDLISPLDTISQKN